MGKVAIPPCPNCGSTKTKKIDAPFALRKKEGMEFANGSNAKDPKIYCLSCHFKWSNK